MEVKSLRDEKFVEVAARCVDGVDAQFSGEIESGKNYRLSVALSDISFGTEKYNEAFLASLREKIKAADSARFVIAPTAENALSSTDDALEMTAAFKHCARRIKDCANVSGFEIPRVFSDLERAAELEENFARELAEKHPNYVFYK